MAGWSGTRETAAISSRFILANTASGLLGSVVLGSARGQATPSVSGALLFALAVVAGMGGTAGSFLGSRRLSVPAIRRLLAVTLLVAAYKLFFGA